MALASRMRDRDVRMALRAMLAAEYAHDPNTKIIEEMGIWSGSVRIDVAVINGELIGYELKSDRDTLQRLPIQAQLYSRVFDRVTLVVGSRHAEDAITRIPAWWGITIAKQADTGIALLSERGPQKNPDPDPYLVAQLLWKEEALSVLDQFGLAVGWRHSRVKDIHRRLASQLPFAVLADQVRTILKKRADWLL